MSIAHDELSTTIDTCLADVEIWQALHQEAIENRDGAAGLEQCIRFGRRIFDEFLVAYSPLDTDEFQIHQLCLQEWYRVASSIMQSVRRLAGVGRLAGSSDELEARLAYLGRCRTISVLDCSASSRSFQPHYLQSM